MESKRRSLVDTDNPARRGIEEALLHVQRGWFPVNRTLWSEIKGRAERGDYDKNASLLFNDLKKTKRSLLSRCTNLVPVIGKSVSVSSPFEVLQTLERDRVLKLLQVPETTLFTHTIDPSSKAQTMRIRHSVISASTAETLAESVKLNTRDAFVCSAVRQLGLSLIAWNYPRIYSKALAAAGKSDASLEQLLLKSLGYTPQLLGVKACLNWCEKGDLRLALLGEEKDPYQTPESSPTAKMLSRFCEVGETLAQASDPEVFPSAAVKWQGVVKELNDHLGPKALEIIQNKIEANLGGYKSVAPNAFKVDLASEKAVKVALSHYGTRLMSQNPHAVKCPTLMQEKFRTVYENVMPGQPSPTAVKELVEFVIPALGFVKGCVYLIDSRKAQAVPMLRIGDVTLDRFRALNCQETGGQVHPVVEALSYTSPIVQENAFLNGDRVNHITGVFGNRDKLGVLYLEMSSELAASDRQQALLYFKAARQCLTDCLSMR